jgi:hypothetical protein
MAVRAPQDVDLEDKLIYGLSPLRFAYLVVAALTCLCTWRLETLPAALRLPMCLAVIAAGAGLAWGRWRGQPSDRCLLDAVLFARRNYHVRMGRISLRPRRPGHSVSLSAINALAATRTRIL